MKDSFKVLKNLVWITQLAFSVVGPLVLCIMGAVWLRDRFELGGWVVVLGVFLGLGGAVSGFRSSLRSMDRAGKEEDRDVPPSFNDHE